MLPREQSDQNLRPLVKGALQKNIFLILFKVLKKIYDFMVFIFFVIIVCLSFICPLSLNFTLSYIYILNYLIK